MALDNYIQLVLAAFMKVFSKMICHIFKVIYFMLMGISSNVIIGIKVKPMVKGCLLN
jgi:hypothetical protein